MRALRRGAALARVSSKLYSLSLSHPAHAARLMLERKHIDHAVVDLLPGFHPLQLRLAGFRGTTVPALKMDSRRIQGSLTISRALDEAVPEPSLFPSDSGRLRAVEEAERWGERELQPIPRRLIRWATNRHLHIRRWMAEEIVGMPAPKLVARTNAPVAAAFARKSGADDRRVRADLAALPAMLDRVDALIADRTIGADDPNAADFQVGTSVRVLMAFEDLAPLVGERPAGALAMHLLPEYPGPIPAALPREWVPATGP
jgi:glutathione S-transferase